MNILRQGAHWVLLLWCASALVPGRQRCTGRYCTGATKLGTDTRLTVDKKVSMHLYRASDQQLIWTDPLLYRQLQHGIEDSYLDGLNTADYRPNFGNRQDQRIDQPR